MESVVVITDLEMVVREDPMDLVEAGLYCGA